MSALAIWREHDVARAIHAVDRTAVDVTESARALVLELLASPDAPPPARAGAGGARDLYNACAALGRLLAEAGASPTLAVSTLEGATSALGHDGIAIEAAVLTAARAAVAEAYVAARTEAERREGLAAWEYPACAARLDDTTVAITCGVPSEEREAVAEWAARVALAASKDRVKAVVASGPALARAELAAALELLGIHVETERVGRHRAPSDASAAVRVERREGWLRLPWRK